MNIPKNNNDNFEMDEELEDSLIVRQRLAEPFITISNDCVWKELGLQETDETP